MNQPVRRVGRLKAGRCGPLFALIVLLWPAIGLAAKTDVVVLQNGDKITGEVKSMSRGKLDYSTDDAGRLAIEWIKVARMTSSNTFEVEMASGVKYLGRLGVTDRDGVLAVVESGVDTLAIPSVVRISALDARFFQRVQAYLDLGFTFAKANQATTFNAAGGTSYRGDKIGSGLTINSYAQGQESTATTSRASVALSVTRYLPKRWSVVAVGGAEQNDELDLALRVSGAGVVARNLVRSNSSELGVGGGLAVTRERFSQTDGDPAGEENTSTSLEGLLVARWDAFRYDSPKLDFSTSIYLHSSLSTSAGPAASSPPG
jgi:hypothetical protein